MNNIKVIIIVPIYNEEKNIGLLIEDLRCVDYDVLFIDDCSTDKSYSLLKEKKQNVIALPINLGIGGCVQTGYVYAYNNDYDIAIQYDGDGQHIAKYTKNLVDAIIAGNEYVIGSRYVGEKEGFQSTATRRIGIKLLSFLIFLVSGKVIKDVTSGFRACNKELIKLFTKYYPTDYPEPEVAGALSRQGYKVTEVSVVMRERQGGNSSIKPFKSIYYMIKVGLAILILSRSYKRSK